MLSKRGPRACDICRNRKVRCNVARIGLPCSNCSRASATCAVSNTTRRKPQAERPSPNTVPPGNIYTFKVSAPQAQGLSSEEATTVAATTSVQASPEKDLHNATEILSGDAADIPLPRNQLEFPEYITPLPESIDPDILQLLCQKGALEVPRKDIVDELFKGFICYVYPLFPVVELGGFIDAMSGVSGNTISLLLFQAVMMAGAAFSDLSSLQPMSSPSSNEVQRTFFERVKLLFEMDVESNPTTMIQALLLMTYWHSRLNDTKGRVYWLSIALSLATGIGLYNPLHHSDHPYQQRFRRRLWACCIIRSQLLSLTERRHVSLPCGARDIRAIQQDDWDDMSLIRALAKYNMPSRDIEVHAMGQLFIQKVKLCGIIKNVLDSQYELSGLRRVDSSDALMMLIPKRKAPSVPVIAQDQELREWYGETTFPKNTAFGQDHRSNGIVLGVHSATLEMLYWTVLSAVHRPHLLDDQCTDSAIGALQAYSCLTLRSAARRIIEIGRNLEDGNLIQFLPPLSVGVFIAASIQHLKDAMSTDPERRGTGSLYLGQTLNVFAELKKRYNHVDTAIEFIERVQNGKVFYHSVEWEDRVDPPGRGDNDPANGPTMETNAAGIRTPSQFQMQNANIRLTEQSRGTTPRSLLDGNDFFDMPYLSVPNLEGFPEVFLSNLV